MAQVSLQKTKTARMANVNIYDTSVLANKEVANTNNTPKFDTILSFWMTSKWYLISLEIMTTSLYLN